MLIKPLSIEYRAAAEAAAWSESAFRCHQTRSTASVDLISLEQVQ